MDNKKTKPIENKEITDVVSFGSKDTYIIVETIAKFGNMMNYLNTQNTIYRYSEKGYESLPIEFDFEKSKEYKLVFSQTMKIVIEGKESILSKENFNKALNIEKDIFNKALTSILKESDGVGFILGNIRTT